MPHGYAVEPADPPWPPGNGPVFMTSLTNPVTNFISQLSWERTGTDPGRVGLADTDNGIDFVWTNPNPSADTPGNRV